MPSAAFWRGCEIAGLSVNSIDYAQMPWREQVATTAGCDILVGVHGNAARRRSSRATGSSRMSRPLRRSDPRQECPRQPRPSCNQVVIEGRPLRAARAPRARPRAAAASLKRVDFPHAPCEPPRSSPSPDRAASRLEDPTCVLRHERLAQARDRVLPRLPLPDLAAVVSILSQTGALARRENRWARQDDGPSSTRRRALGSALALRRSNPPLPLGAA